MNEKLVRILLVEDNDADVYLFRKALENAALNFELTIIEDGAAALDFVIGQGAYAGRPVPDLAVLDMNVPKNDTIEVLKSMRQSEDLSLVPVVIVTSLASPGARAKAEPFCVERYITKPTGLDEFLQIGAILRDVLLDCKTRHSAA